MKSKAIIIILIISLAVSILINFAKVELSEYESLQNDYERTEDENNDLKSQSELLLANMKTLKDKNENLNKKIESYEQELAETDGLIEDFVNFMRVYKQRAIYSDFIVDMRGTPKFENYDEYERAIFETSNVEELFDLYRWNLDGAAAEGYGANLYYYYKVIGEADFIKNA